MGRILTKSNRDKVNKLLILLNQKKIKAFNIKSHLRNAAARARIQLNL